MTVHRLVVGSTSDEFGHSGESRCAMVQNARELVSGVELSADIDRNDAQQITHILAFLVGAFIWRTMVLRIVQRDPRL